MFSHSVHLQKWGRARFTYYAFTNVTVTFQKCNFLGKKVVSNFEGHCPGQKYLNSLYGASRRIMSLSKESYPGASRRIMFCETHPFRDFASRNHEKDVSHKKIFCRRRRQKNFHTTPILVNMYSPKSHFLLLVVAKGNKSYCPAGKRLKVSKTFYLVSRNG